MPPSIESQLSENDHSIIEASQLGAPLGVYTLKPGYIRFVFWCGLFFLIGGVFVVVTVITISLVQWHQALALHHEQAENYLDFLFPSSSSLFPTVGECLTAVVGCLVTLGIEFPRARREHVIVCEHGFVQMGKKIWSNHVEVVRWSDIHNITAGLFDYNIERREGNVIVLSGYQHGGDLMALIRQRSGVE